MFHSESKPVFDRLDATKQLESTLTTMRDDLKRLVQSRLDRRLHGRVDASDVIQETFIAAYQRYSDYVRDPEVPLADWIRFLTVQSVQATHRKHLGTQKRSVGRELEQRDVGSVQDAIHLFPANRDWSANSGVESRNSGSGSRID